MSDETSPRPWRWVTTPPKDVLNDADGVAIIVVERGTLPSDANAALIVRAVNLHDELVAMVERLISDGVAYSCTDTAVDAIYDAGELLTRAKEGT